MARKPSLASHLHDVWAKLRLFNQGWGTGTSWTALRRLTTCGLIWLYLTWSYLHEYNKPLTRQISQVTTDQRNNSLMRKISQVYSRIRDMWFHLNTASPTTHAL